MLLHETFTIKDGKKISVAVSSDGSVTIEGAFQIEAFFDIGQCKNGDKSLYSARVVIDTIQDGNLRVRLLLPNHSSALATDTTPIIDVASQCDGRLVVLSGFGYRQIEERYHPNHNTKAKSQINPPNE